MCAMKHRTMRRHDVPGAARFLTFGCYRRLKLLGNEKIRDLFIERLTDVAVVEKVEVLAWVVMPDHVHLVVYVDDGAIDVTRFTHSLKRPFAREVLNRWRKLEAPILAKLAQGDGHRFWQTGGGYDRNVTGREVWVKIDYIHDNPVRKGLVAQRANYRWSSAAAYDGSEYVGPRVDLSLLPFRM